VASRHYAPVKNADTVEASCAEQACRADSEYGSPE
jgi:hypothetical protein